MARSWQSETKLSLFLFLLIVVGFVLPLIGFEKRRYLPLYADIAFSGVLVVGAAIAWGNRKLFILTSLVCMVAIVMRWVSWLKPTDTLILWRVSTGLIAILALAGVLLWQVFRSGSVTAMRIQGAFADYLCLGFGWAHAYHLVSLSVPDAFSSAGSDVSVVSTWVNYSFK